MKAIDRAIEELKGYKTSFGGYLHVSQIFRVLEEERDRDKWISVEEGLPETRRRILAVNMKAEKPEVHFTVLLSECRESFKFSYTHWQYEPELPKGE